MNPFRCCFGGRDLIIEDEGLRPEVEFGWEEIRNGTMYFRSSLLISPPDNFRKVYRCKFSSRLDMVGAAKIFRPHDTYFDLEKFETETTMLREADHPNVIKIIGTQYGHRKGVIVYEFMPHGSLDYHLFAHAMNRPGLTQPSRVLDWETRMRIALGVAQGLV